MPVKLSLDHYMGRSFDEIIWGEGASDWAIKLEGGVLIRNKDNRRTLFPTDLAGKSLMLVTYSELDTVLHFRMGENGPVSEVTLTPTQYTLADPAQYGETEIYPQVTDPEETVIPADPSAERVADGPEETPLEDTETPQEATNDE